MRVKQLSQSGKAVQEVRHVSDRHEVDGREHPEPGEALVAHQRGLPPVIIHAKASLGVKIEIDADENAS